MKSLRLVGQVTARRVRRAGSAPVAWMKAGYESGRTDAS